METPAKIESKWNNKREKKEKKNGRTKYCYSFSARALVKQIFAEIIYDCRRSSCPCLNCQNDQVFFFFSFMFSFFFRFCVYHMSHTECGLMKYIYDVSQSQSNFTCAFFCIIFSSFAYTHTRSSRWIWLADKKKKKNEFKTKFRNWINFSLYFFVSSIRTLFWVELKCCASQKWGKPKRRILFNILLFPSHKTMHLKWNK